MLHFFSLCLYFHKAKTLFFHTQIHPANGWWENDRSIFFSNFALIGLSFRAVVFIWTTEFSTMMPASVQFTTFFTIRLVDCVQYIFHAVSAIFSIGSVFLSADLHVLTFFIWSYFKFLLYKHKYRVHCKARAH